MSGRRLGKKTGPGATKKVAPASESSRSNLGELPDYAAKNIDLEEDMFQKPNE
ncbi:MAG: hypothetical protein MK036_01185 [Dehalococcoidia bacterium]|jgi:hypothetical protein|nr:hypothetical protein [Dehalococcoidia bacterium]|tara:strand:- start:2689 stop:2847 length:159 start_codon:yes stop_codon:yes gene_type:complete